jgi:hypothetical protein
MAIATRCQQIGAHIGRSVEQDVGDFQFLVLHPLQGDAQPVAGQVAIEVRTRFPPPSTSARGFTVTTLTDLPSP